MKEPILHIENVAKSFGNAAVLNEVSAALLPGTITAFVGPNGAGKTTLFHTISGDIIPDSGVILFHGTPITKVAPWKIARKGLGKMFQDVRVFQNLTIIENMLLALHEYSEQSAFASLARARTWKQSEENMIDQAEICLRRAGVEPPYNRPAGLLSFGNKKLLAFARLMAGRFDLLLLDEPTAGLSPLMMSRISDLLVELCSQGTTIALIEHNFSFVSAVAEHTYLVQRGRVSDFGLTSEVLNKESNREVLIGL